MTQTFFNEINHISARVAELQTRHKPVVIAIDGPAASGKSTLGAQLAETLDAALIHMDDFFLPPGMRTPQRLKTPGGNVYHERFAREVVPYLHSGQLFGYRVYDAHRQEYTGSRTVWPKDVIIVEGSYSMHPAFGDIYDLRIFCKVSPYEQSRRIAETRAQVADMFKALWIPMENRYFDAFHIESTCHITVTSGAPQPPPPLEIERKFLIRMPDLQHLEAEASRVIAIEQVYLTGAAPGVSMRIRKSTEQGSVTYYRNEKRPISHMVRVEEEAEITLQHYNILLGFADPKLRPVRKTRYCVPMGDLTAEIDIFPFWQNQAFCEVELPEESAAVILPDWLDVMREVTEDKRYTNLALAKEIPPED